MSNNENNVKEILKKYGLFTKELGDINYHLNIFNCNPKYLVRRLSRNGLITTDPISSEEDLAYLISGLIQKCNVNNTEYDSKIDEEMTRIGQKTDRFDCPSKCSKWNNSMISDDDSGYGTRATDVYDGYTDSMGGPVKCIGKK